MRRSASVNSRYCDWLRKGSSANRNSGKALMKLFAARILTFALLASGCSVVMLGQVKHPRLLPQPREIQYADGWVNVRQLCAAPIPHAATEDEFALKTLKDGLRVSLPSCAGD